jgi:hypothetical protein
MRGGDIYAHMCASLCSPNGHPAIQAKYTYSTLLPAFLFGCGVYASATPSYIVCRFTNRLPVCLFLWVFSYMTICIFGFFPIEFFITLHLHLPICLFQQWGLQYLSTCPAFLIGTSILHTFAPVGHSQRYPPYWLIQRAPWPQGLEWHSFRSTH